MNCPEHLVLKAFDGRLWVWMYWRDVPRERIPLRVWLSPLRYEISVTAFGRRFVVNREGRAHWYFDYAVWHLSRMLRGQWGGP